MRMLCFMTLGLFFALIASPLMATPAQKDAASSQSSLATGQRLFLEQQVTITRDADIEWCFVLCQAFNNGS